MKLTTKSEYSLLALIYLARQKEDRFVHVEEICQEYGIAKKYLEQLLFVLKQNHYIRTKRGASGGYKLAKPAKKISLAEVFRLMDGALAPIESVSRYFFTKTPLSREPKAIVVLKGIRDYIVEQLTRVTVADLM